MQKNLTLSIILLILFFLLGSCIRGKKKFYNPINLYFSPTEDYLMSQEFFPNFINYPDDKTKLGLRGNVKEVNYNTLHFLSYLFNEKGQLQTKMLIASGGSQKETSAYEHVYNESGFPVQIIEERMINFGKGNRSTGKKEIDKITEYTSSGKPLVRAINELNRNKIDHIIRYEYDKNNICRGVALTENSPKQKEGTIAFNFTCNEKGLITYIHAQRTRIPYRFTQGERKITPSYDFRGRLISLKEIAIPKNMEAYRIDSIASETHYKYNRKGDIIKCEYSDIVYPDNSTNNFTLTFEYEYDKQGNWIKKHIIGDINAVGASMNTYYRDNYTINRINKEGEETLGEIILEREISYYGNEKSASTPKKSNEKINIPKTTGVLGESEYYEILKNERAFGNSSSKGMPTMNSSNRKKYKIDEISCISEEKVFYGKLIHQTDTWRMESILGYTPDHMIQEYFVFYDDADNYISCFIPGSHLFYAGDLTRSEIEGNRITCMTEWSEPGSGSGVVYVQYEITPQLTVKEIKRWETFEESAL